MSWSATLIFVSYFLVHTGVPVIWVFEYVFPLLFIFFLVWYYSYNQPPRFIVDFGHAKGLIVTILMLAITVFVLFLIVVSKNFTHPTGVALRN